MSEENVEIVRSLYRAMNARDTAAAADLLHPETEWIPDRRGGEGPAQGREGVIHFFSDREEMFDELHVEAESYRHVDDKVIAFLRVTGRGHASGAEVDIR